MLWNHIASPIKLDEGWDLLDDTPMSKLKQMLLARKKEVEAEIQKATAPLQAELREIELALSAIGGTVSVQHSMPFKLKPPTVKKSVTEQVTEILENNKNGIKTVDIAEILRSDYGRTIKNQDVSWYLSKLKKDEKVTLEDGGLWKVVDVFE